MLTMRTSERTRNTENHNEPPKRFELTSRGRAVAGLGSAALAAAIAFGSVASLGNQSNEVQSGNISQAEFNTTISSVTLEDGANLRSDPFVQDKDMSNRLDQLDLGDTKDIVITTEDGVQISEDEDGTWYGIKADNLTELLDVDVENDKDGIVWVNEDRASENHDS